MKDVSQFYLEEKRKIESLSSFEEVKNCFEEFNKAILNHPYKQGHTVDMDEYNHYLDLVALVDGPLQDRYWWFYPQSKQ
jgi:hypothetical protein